MTAKQWLDENNICEQTYYHWIKIIRQKTYEPAATSANTACVKTMRSEVAFAEIPLPAINPVSAGENGFRPDITIQTGSVLIGVSNTASDALLGKLLEVIGHARWSSRCFEDYYCLWIILTIFLSSSFLATAIFLYLCFKKMRITFSS